ncbi:hypothetical protein ISF_00438 [Cordyceps fumosorosea ARSEF 2679]|uniref:Uncharacterized protein n=1 Tax=Cordyceps fumosorosea (strain ARSEF 2679) TaxID=1081104 RepID=A0A168E9F9_CORFA|nr:hypothetical protein ISF_00438 [Cordyceps fumosorosea ARSEF 2679]OAA73537.1 hypothetical protein ISF_00438 [Cordyceps fumosorosea ARSEF 2679]
MSAKIRNKTLRAIPPAEDMAAAFAARSAVHENGAHFPAAALQLPEAGDILPQLPDDANAIDRAIFERLQLVWKEEASGWTEEMRQSLRSSMFRARVTRTTVKPSSHCTIRRLRRGKEVPTWGEFVVLRTMFGAGVCFGEPWAEALAERHPLAREDAYGGVVPAQPRVATDVLDGKVGLRPASLRRISVRTLGPEKSRVYKRRVGSGPMATTVTRKMKKDEAKQDDTGSEDDGGGKGRGLWQGQQQQQQKKEKKKRADEKPRGNGMPAASGIAGDEAAVSAGRIGLNAVIATLRQCSHDQEEQINRLRASNELIRKSLLDLNAMAEQVRDD